MSEFIEKKIIIKGTDKFDVDRLKLTDKKDLFEKKAILKEIEEKGKKNESNEVINPENNSSNALTQTTFTNASKENITAKNTEVNTDYAEKANLKKKAAKTAISKLVKERKTRGFNEKDASDVLSDVKDKGRAVVQMGVEAALGEILASVMPYILKGLAGFALVFTIVITISGAITNGTSGSVDVKGDGYSTNQVISEEKINEILSKVSCDDKTKKVLQFALSKVGSPYSQTLRNDGIHYDCSSLAYYAYKSVGITIGQYSAAEQCREMVNNKQEVNFKDIAPGDLVYYGGKENHRYLGIYHVAIYIGNGKAVEAYNEQKGVIYQDLRKPNIVKICRPK